MLTAWTMARHAPQLAPRLVPPLSASLGYASWAQHLGLSVSAGLPRALGLMRPNPNIAAAPPSSTLLDWQLWLVTQLLDYAWMLLTAAVVSILFGVRRGATAAALACTSLGFASVAILQHREVLNFWILADRVPHSKRRPLPAKSHRFVFQTAAASMLSYFAMHQTALVYFTPPALTLSFWLSIFVPFYLLLALRDVFFLAPLHARLHTPQWYHLHKLHHEPTKSAQSLHAFYIDLVDLIIENVGAPFLLFGLQLVLQRPVGIHWFVGVLLTCHDGALHSVNPHSAMYFNPVLDAIFKGNVHHQLHHALNKKSHLLFVPWSHMLPARRHADCELYNRVFCTDLAPSSE